MCLAWTDSRTRCLARENAVLRSWVARPLSAGSTQQLDTHLMCPVVLGGNLYRYDIDAVKIPFSPLPCVGHLLFHGIYRNHSIPVARCLPTGKNSGNLIFFLEKTQNLAINI